MAAIARGQLVGNRYRIQNRIGEGGMSFVYVAVDEKLSRKVAIKILHQHLAESFDIRNRFFNEAKAISVLDHPNIINIYDFSGENSEQLWMVTEILNGLTLSAYMKTQENGRLPALLSALILREVLRGVEAAHSKGIVHRDIKPDNVMISNHGQIKLMDFGIAKNLEAHSMTLTGTFMGSPSYMSPEQVRGKTIDQRSDIYSLGILAYELSTGVLPFIGLSTHDIIIKICEGKYRKPKRVIKDLPKQFEALITKAMQLHPQNRFPSAESMSADIDSYLKAFGFEESHIELERYFSDKESFNTKIKSLTLTKKLEFGEEEDTLKISNNDHRNKTNKNGHTLFFDRSKRSRIRKFAELEATAPRKPLFTVLEPALNPVKIQKKELDIEKIKKLAIQRRTHLETQYREDARRISGVFLVGLLLVLSIAGFLQFTNAGSKIDGQNKYSKMTIDRLDTSLFAASSNLLITTEADVTFYLNGRNLTKQTKNALDQQQLNLRLRAGKYELRFLKPGYEPQVGQVSLQAGKIFKLKPKPWKLIKKDDELNSFGDLRGDL